METTEKKKPSKLRLVLALIGVLFFAWLIFGGNEKLAQNKMQQIQNKVAEDAVEQYNIAYRQGDKMQIYVQAGMVAAAYLQAKDEANYQKWKEIEKQAAAEAGMPQ